jgi:FkbM family methyltransferase
VSGSLRNTQLFGVFSPKEDDKFLKKRFESGQAMIGNWKKAFRPSLRGFDIALLRHSHYERIQEQAKNNNDLAFIIAMYGESAPPIVENLKYSKSQLRQDLFVLTHLNFKKSGYFVEFGATNGIDLSNTHLLETRFDWKGILAEPAKCWHPDLVRNRKASIIDTRCVWKKSGATLRFSEVGYAELSTISEFNSSDSHNRRDRLEYDVQTVSLIDLLDEHKAPPVIDFISIDTEGSEFEILNGFDFARYLFRVITCEHNHTANREKIRSLLTKNGYVQRFEELSQFDDWYVLPGID